MSNLARRSSASAARSVFGGFVELDAGPEEPTDAPLAARCVVPAGDLDWRLLVVTLGDAKKEVSSSDGMILTAANSPYHAAWLDVAPRLHAEIRAAVLARDFERFGATAEKSALAMHASAFAAGVVYWQAATLEVLAAVRSLRARGTAVFATMDAGPHVKVMLRPEDVALASACLQAVPGVGRVFEARGAEGAQLLDGPGGADA